MFAIYRCDKEFIIYSTVGEYSKTRSFDSVKIWRLRLKMTSFLLWDLWRCIIFADLAMCTSSVLEVFAGRRVNYQTA